jgi:hypothetical protein
LDVLLHINPQFSSRHHGHTHKGRNPNDIKVGEIIQVPHLPGWTEKKQVRTHQIKEKPDHHSSLNDIQDWLLAQGKYLLGVLSPPPAKRAPRKLPATAAPTPAPAPETWQ